MKNFILGVFAALALVITVAATPVGENLMTVKPATPKQTVVYNYTKPENFVREWAAKGFVVTQATGLSGDYIFVVMVKY